MSSLLTTRTCASNHDLKGSAGGRMRPINSDRIGKDDDLIGRMNRHKVNGYDGTVSFDPTSLPNCIKFC